jgi:multiple sugar transport system ATP-binding protein
VIAVLDDLVRPPTIAPPVPAGIALHGVRHRYGATPVLDVERLEIPSGALCVVVGPSGCGKSTMLSLVAGLLTAEAGRIEVAGADVTGAAPGDRDLSMVFQDFALYPHMTVADNIAFGLRLQARHARGAGPDKTEITRRVDDVCERLGLSALRGRRPRQLSGGERQRVALARAIVRRRSVLLLDEPLSSLDAQLRQRARAELVLLHRELGATMVMVTHDQLEALSVATHLVVMRAGEVVQHGTPGEVYRAPVDEFVATFLGSPAMNVHDVDGLRLGWRPADARLVGPADGGAPDALELAAVVDVVEFTGDGRIVHCTGAAGRFAVVESLELPREVGDAVLVRVPRAALHRFDPTTGRRVSAG